MIRRFFRAATRRSAHVKGEKSRLGPNAIIQNIQRQPSQIAIGANSIILGELLIFAHGGKIEIGNDVFVGENSRIWSAGSIKIGSRVLISHDVNIFDNDTHPMDAEERHRHYLAIASTGHPKELNLGELPVVIEDDAWVAAKAIILKGVTVGRGAIIGAGAVVTRDVPPFALVAGNPARVVRQQEPASKE